MACWRLFFSFFTLSLARIVTAGHGGSESVRTQANEPFLKASSLGAAGGLLNRLRSTARKQQGSAVGQGKKHKEALLRSELPTHDLSRQLREGVQTRVKSSCNGARMRLTAKDLSMSGDLLIL
mmetsp:Transcript_8034/g.26894  ORF Transcript_8034/g.26894 Transcript_8034/m.26894 type:complete len:123 (-) Transcript_8034:782-1150(-)